MTVYYQIGEFAQLSGVSTKTLRFYDEIGLLRPAAVDSRTRYRHYRPQQMQDLASILALKELGVSLHEIRNVIGKAGAAGRTRQLLERHRDKVRGSIETAKQSLGWINGALDELGDSKPVIPVVIKRRPAVRIASVRAAIPNYADILNVERELLNALPPESLGPLRGVLWHRCADSGSLEGEPFVELKRDLPRGSFYDLKQLPPVMVACAYSSSEDDTAEQAYEAIRKWMQIRGLLLAGAKREIYLGQLLEIQFPLKSA